MGIPVVPIAYSDKTKNALDEIGYSGKIYDVNNIDTDEVLRSILNAVPYKLDGNIIKSAENHIKRFDEYIKRQWLKAVVFLYVFHIVYTGVFTGVMISAILLKINYIRGLYVMNELVKEIRANWKKREKCCNSCSLLC